MNILNKKLLTLLGLLIFAISIPLTVFLAKQRQEIKSKAQEVQEQNVSALPATKKFGINYYKPWMAEMISPLPPTFCKNWLWLSSSWPNCKPLVEKDFYIIKSFGGSVLRLVVFPSNTGYVIDPCQGIISRGVPEWVKRNLREVLQLAQQNDFEVILIFNNFYASPKKESCQDQVTPTPTPIPNQTWWQWAYGNTEEGFQQFLADSKLWMQGLIDATNSSPNLLYYDLFAETTDTIPRMWDYVRFARDNLRDIPAGKYGISVLCADQNGVCANKVNDVVKLKTELGNRQLDFIDFHTYPEYYYGPQNADVQQIYQSVISYFPNSQIIVGEYGTGLGWPQRLYWPSDILIASPEALAKEDDQARYESNIVSRILATPISYFLHWRLFDSCGQGSNACSPTDPGRIGWGYSPEEPRDVYGTMAERFSLIPNSDFEQGTTTPSGWSVGGTGATLVWGTGEPDSATNNHYGRVQTSSPNAHVWLVNNTIPIPQTSTGLEVYLNAFLRSNMSSVTINIVEYDSNRDRIRTTPIPAFVPTSNWENLQYKVGPWKMTLLPNTRYLNVAFGGTSGTVLPATLDVDAVTLNLRNLPTVPTPTPTPTPTRTPSPTPTPISTPVPDSPDRSPYGVWGSPHLGHSIAQKIDLSQKLEAAGVKWVRTWGLGWINVQPHNKKEWNWEALDLVYQMSHNYDLRVVGVLYGTPSWASSAPGCPTNCWPDYMYYPPRDWDDWTNFLNRLVTRYGSQGNNQVHYWEIWNEPDAFFFTVSRGQDKLQAYFELLRRSYEAIKRADPSAKVLIGGASGRSLGPDEGSGQWWDDLLALGAGLYFDIFNIHSYSRHVDSVTATVIAKGLLAKYNLSKPIWMTETNPEGELVPDNNTEANVAAILPAWYENTLRAGAEKVFWSAAVNYCRKPVNCDPILNPSAWGLLHLTGARTADINPLIYSAYKNMALTYTPPSQPALVSPANNSQTTNSKPTFRWNGVSPGSNPLVGYMIQVDNTDGNFLTPEINSSTTAVEFTPPTNLAQGTYYWRVKAKDTKGNFGSWSESWKVTITIPTPTPTPTNPPPPPTGEYGDNVLDIRDYNTFVSCFRKKVSEVSSCEAADLNDDGVVDSSDFVLLFESFQTQYGD